MNISITFRQMDATEAVKGYANDKAAKLQKFLRATSPRTGDPQLSEDSPPRGGRSDLG